MLPDTGEPDIENIVWANKRERNLSLLIIQYGPNLPLFLFGAYIEAAVCHIECYSQIDHAVVFAPVFLVVYLKSATIIQYTIKGRFMNR
jgi:hypothetical protein